MQDCSTSDSVLQQNAYNVVIHGDSGGTHSGGSCCPSSGGDPEWETLPLLGNITSIVTPKSGEGEKDAKSRRIGRFLIQAVISDILDKERVSSCLRAILPRVDTVEVLYSAKVKRAHFGNLMVCGSVWACPVCAAKITERRRLELEAGLAGWKGGVIAGDFTFQHTREDTLDDLKKVLSKCYRRLQMGKGWELFKKRWGIVGSLTSSEITWGQGAGWHPHKHVLFFSEGKDIEQNYLQIQEELSERFRGFLADEGRYAHPDIGVFFKAGDALHNLDYACKWGLDYEMTKGHVKKGRGDNYSPFELASWAGATGEYLPVQLFREYYSVYKGSNQLNWSKGMRSMLALGVEKTDEELAAEQEQDAIILATLARDAWKIICQKGKRGELLEAASLGSKEFLDMFFEKFGINV